MVPKYRDSIYRRPRQRLDTKDIHLKAHEIASGAVSGQHKIYANEYYHHLHFDFQNNILFRTLNKRIINNNSLLLKNILSRHFPRWQKTQTCKKTHIIIPKCQMTKTNFEKNQKFLYCITLYVLPLILLI